MEKVYAAEGPIKSGRNRIIRVALGILTTTFFLLCLFLIGFVLKDKWNKLGDLTRNVNLPDRYQAAAIDAPEGKTGGR